MSEDKHNALDAKLQSIKQFGFALRQSFTQSLDNQNLAYGVTSNFPGVLTPQYRSIYLCH